MRLMPYKDALRLFRAKLGAGASQSAVCKKMQEKVVKACGRLPLALGIVGGCLSGDADEQQWQVI